MSIQSARDFLVKIAKDEEFRNRLSACKTTVEQLRCAQEAGFEFTSDEMRAAHSELQDVDLEVISGGVLYSNYCPKDLASCSLLIGG